MQAILSFLISLVVGILSVFNFLPTPEKTYTPKKSDVLLTAAVMSDTHIDYKEYFVQSILVNGLKDPAVSSSNVDVVINAGDLTNYGDPESIDKFFEIHKKYCPSSEWIMATGNHEIGHIEDGFQEEARQHFISKYNEYTGSEIGKIYYSKVVNNYRFIVLGDEADKSWDWPLITDEQIAFLDSELQKSAEDGKAAFVICHWPLANKNGEQIIWDEGDIDDSSDAIQAVLEKYQNVFFISGHLHAGLNGVITKDLFDVCCVETVNGVHYINLPTFGLVNRYGIPYGGTGFQMEVYKDEVVFRGRNYITSEWYKNYEFTIDLVK